MCEIREYRESDWPEIWRILQKTVRAGDAYTFSPQSSEEEIRQAWVELPAGTEHSQAQALAMGFKSMQFNFAVSTNMRAVRLSERLRRGRVASLTRRC